MLLAETVLTARRKRQERHPGMMAMMAASMAIAVHPW